MARKRERPRPPYSAPRPGGGWRLQIQDPDTGERLRPRALDPNEPPYYATVGELWTAFDRLTRLVELRLRRGETVTGFAEAWTDPDHWRWGNKRGEHSAKTYASAIGLFVSRFGEREIASITTDDLGAFLSPKQGRKPAESSIPILQRFFDAAVQAELRTDNPWRKLDLTFKASDPEPAPEPEQLDAMLTRAAASPFPYSMYAWLFVGSETGMRTGELDAMRIDRLDLSDPDRPRYRIEEQWHAQLRRFASPKYDSHRTILLPATVLGVIEDMRAEADAYGSPFLFNTTRGGHYSPPARDYYWTGDSRFDGLRALVGGVTMKAATRVYFATRAVLDAPHKIPQIAQHYGHKDKGQTLLSFYTRLTDQHGQDGMAEIFAQRPADLSARRRRRAA